MKKLYLLFLMSFISFIASAQQTVYIWDTAALGTYKSGHSSPFFRFDDTIEVSQSPMQFNGWAVFDLARVPPNSIVSSVEFGYHVVRVDSGGSLFNSWEVRGLTGDISGVSAPSVLMPALAGGTLFWNSDFTSPAHLPGDYTYTATSPSPVTSFIQGNGGNKISISMTGGALGDYIIMGESGSATLTGFHAPYLKVTYTCSGLTTPVATGTPDTLCQFTPLSLTGFAPGGVNYTWRGPHGFTATGATVTAIADTTCKYEIIARNSVGCFYSDSSNLIFVRPAPPAVITPIPLQDTTFCAGGSVLLDADTGDPTDIYQWFENGAPITGATNASYTVTSTGNYRVRITNAQSCENTSRDVQCLELNNPTITPSGSITACTGGSLLLSVNTGGGIGGLHFQWKRNLAAIPGATNSTYAATTSGNYTVDIYIIANPSCPVTTLPTVVSIFPIPTPAITYTASMLNTPNIYANYQWFLNLTAIPGATAYNYHPTVPGSYNVQITDYNGCSNYSNSIVIGQTNTSVDQAILPGVSLYPNPATNTVSILAQVPVTAIITSIDGKTLLAPVTTGNIDISMLPKGLYMVQVFDTNGTKLSVQKLLKD